MLLCPIAVKQKEHATGRAVHYSVGGLRRAACIAQEHDYHRSGSDDCRAMPISAPYIIRTMAGALPCHERGRRFPASVVILFPDGESFWCRRSARCHRGVRGGGVLRRD